MPQRRHLTRSLLHAVVAAAVTVAGSLAFTTWSDGAVPRQSASAVVVAAEPGEVVSITLSDPSAHHVVDLVFGGRSATLLLTAAEPAATVQLPWNPDGEALRATITPAADSVVGPSPGPAATSLDWRPLSLPEALPDATPVDGSGTASAAVADMDIFGVRAEGVPVRADPAESARPLRTYFHGDVLRSSCWVIGDTVTDGYYYNSEGAYTSDVWFRVTTWAGEEGWIPDAFYARADHLDRLGLPECPGVVPGAREAEWPRAVER